MCTLNHCFSSQFLWDRMLRLCLCLYGIWNKRWLLLTFTPSLLGRNSAVKTNKKKQLEMSGITCRMYFPVPRMLSTLLSRTFNFYFKCFAVWEKNSSPYVGETVQTPETTWRRRMNKVKLGLKTCKPLSETGENCP